MKWEKYAPALACAKSGSWAQGRNVCPEPLRLSTSERRRWGPRQELPGTGAKEGSKQMDRAAMPRFCSRLGSPRMKHNRSPPLRRDPKKRWPEPLMMPGI